MLGRSWIARLPLNKIVDAAHDGNIPWPMLAAIVQVESGGEPAATRFEQHYTYLYKVKDFSSQNGITEITEAVHQKTSWGLTQIMGALARELGHNGQLPELIDPDLNLRLCCKHLTNLIKRYPKREDMLAAYNAGSPIKGIDGKYKNQGYVDKVLNRFYALNEAFDYKL
jgi:hypothetical protein